MISKARNIIDMNNYMNKSFLIAKFKVHMQNSGIIMNVL